MPEINLLHKYPKAKRNITARAEKTAEDRRISSQFGFEYFDGDRRYGYGGYKYDGRWLPIAETFIEHWGLKPGDRVLDIGCAKGFLVKDLMKACPGLEVFGLDISEYAVKNCEPELVGRIHVRNCVSLPFPDNSFKAAISINTFHNLERAECVTAIKEMVRVAPDCGYIQVDSYRTEEERNLFLDWVLTAKTHDYPDEWRKIFAEAGYKNDYYWTIVE